MGLITFKKYKRIEEMKPEVIVAKNKAEEPVDEVLVVAEPKVEKPMEEPVRRGSNRKK